MKTFLLFSIFISSLSALATSTTPLSKGPQNVAELETALAKGTSAEQVLKDLFKNASTPITLDDFDSFGANSNMHCAVDTKQGVVAAPVYKKYSCVTKAAVPAQGPLFPAKPEQRKTILVPDTLTDNDEADGLCANSAITKFSESKMLALNTGTPIFIDNSDDDGVDLAAVVIFKRSGNLIPYMMIIPYPNKKDSAFVFNGYCWRD
jgi:hypothetical protein